MAGILGWIIGGLGLAVAAAAMMLLWQENRRFRALAELNQASASLEQDFQLKNQELELTQARLAAALHGACVSVFSEDKGGLYTYASNPAFGCSLDQIIGRPHAEFLPAESAEAIGALKATVIATGQPHRGEINVREDRNLRWYECYIEPVNDADGAVTGLTSTALDVTERRKADLHLRLLMRELTHRSKNLLAVIQAMSHQTARYAGSTEAFLDQFSARLQAVATSHDLLVRESWHGVSLCDLSLHQLARYRVPNERRVTLEGPPIQLRPEAAQSLGLALHELAANANRYGALSVPAGRVALSWRQLDNGDGIEINWVESEGPNVATPSHRGFGSLAVEKNLARALDASVDLDFAHSGVRCRMTIPENHLLSASA